MNIDQRSLNPHDLSDLIERFNIDFEQLKNIDTEDHADEVKHLTQSLYLSYLQAKGLTSIESSNLKSRLLELFSEVANTTIIAHIILKVPLPKIKFEEMNEKLVDNQILHAVMDTSDLENPILTINILFIEDRLYEMYDRMTRHYAKNVAAFRIYHEMMHIFLHKNYPGIHQAIPRDKNDPDYYEKYKTNEGEDICNNFAETSLVKCSISSAFEESWVNDIN